MTRRSPLPLYLLLAAAVFMRAVLPQGYMPARSGGGSIAVVVCGSGGVHRIPLANGNDREEERQRAEPPCAFAGLGGAAAPPPSAPEIPPPAAAAIAYADLSASDAARVAERFLPPATGPPLPA